MKKKSIELRKSGKFYSAFGDDAVILHYLLGYKIVAEKGGAGFPESAFNKVINHFEDNEVSYQVYNGEEVVASKDFKKMNSYSTLLKKGYQTLDVEARFKKIMNKVELMNQSEINSLLELVEDAINK